MQQQDFEYPDDCLVDFDLRLIDLFHEMAKKRAKRKIGSAVNTSVL